MPVKITVDLARAAGDFAANQQMQTEGRTIWNEADRALAAEVMHRLMLDRAPPTVLAPSASTEASDSA